MNENMKQCCTFKVNGFLFGVDVLSVREIVENQRATKVPLSSVNIAGLINLRGEIVTSIDLRHRFPMGKTIPGENPMNIVVITGEGPISLVVDEVGDVIDMDPTCLEPTPDSLRTEVRELISGVYKMDGRLMLILDVESAVNVTEQVA
jgi:purine-binding chemotaxis protein CheW